MSLPLSLGWRDLLFANWPVDPGTVAPHVPEALDVEEFDGDAWLSVVAYRFVRVRPRGLPAFLGLALPGLNLRTYVACDGEPGVYFFSVDAPSLAAVVGARLAHHLPYYYARSRRRAADSRVRVRSRRTHPGARPARFVATYEPAGECFVPERGSLAAFLVERRRLYTQAGSGALRYSDLAHERWRLAPATVSIERNSLFRASGFAAPDAQPTCYVSPGLDAVTSRSRRWSPEAP